MTTSQTWLKLSVATGTRRMRTPVIARDAPGLGGPVMVAAAAYFQPEWQTMPEQPQMTEPADPVTHLKAALEAGKAKSAELAQQSAEAKATKLELSTSLDAAKRSAAELDKALAIGAGTRTCIGWTFAVVAPDDTELTVSYLDDAGLLMDTASRQAELAERYEFRCECCRCSSDQDDTRRFSECDPSDLVFGSDLWRQAPSTVRQQLLEEEAKAKASLLAARSGDLEEEDEGHELMKCHRFTSAHRHHGLAFALANEFAFPDPEDAKKIVLEVIDLVLAMPCQFRSCKACRPGFRTWKPTRGANAA
eukprot:s2051_g15.t1